MPREEQPAPGPEVIRAAPAIPETIGPYRILGVIGRGGMGVVYRAEHLETGEPAALKTVTVTGANMLSGIRREIHALRRVDHPGVVRVLAEGLDGGLPWYAMDLLQGRSLRDYNEARRAIRAGSDATPSATPQVTQIFPDSVPGAALGAAPQEPAQAQADAEDLVGALTVIRRVCAPLAFVHGKGIVHRDLKPDNIFIRTDGRPILVDFGLAFHFSGGRGRETLEVGGHGVGSPSYMSPEQVRGDLVDARADLYALGCMLYEIVTGAVPFGGGMPMVVLGQHLYQAPVPPSHIVESVPPKLEELILRLLQKRPQDRLGHANDVAAALGELGAGAEMGGPPAQPYLYRPGLAGRADVLPTLEEAIARVGVRKGGMVFIGGESGVGKTRLAMEVATKAARRSLRVVTGECAAISAAEAEGSSVKAAPLHPFRHLLLAVADRCRELGPEETRRLLGDRGRVLALHEPALAQLPGQDQYPEPPALPAQAARYRLMSCLAATLAAFAEQTPVLLLIDDLQWADENSLGFLRFLEPSYFEANGVLILGTYRIEEMSGALRDLVTAPGSTRVELGRLDTKAVARMVSDMLAMDHPPRAFIEYLVRQSEGNPFFIAEYLRVAMEERLLFRNEAGEWRLEEHGGDLDRDRERRSLLPLPKELRALVVRRFARLGPEARALARMASVLGREFDGELLLGATALGTIEGLEALEELRTHQILEEAEPGRLRFGHDKLREILYGDIAPLERRALHGVAARTIETHYAGTPDLPLFYPILAHHFGVAEVADKTLEYLEKAGQQALDTGASEEALGFYRKALDLDDHRIRSASGSAESHDGAGSAATPAAWRRRARLERRLGQASYNLGHLRVAEQHSLAALRCLNGDHAGTPAPAGAGGALARRDEGDEAETGPRSRTRAILSLVWQLGLQMARLVVRRRAAQRSADRERLTEAALAAEKLSEIYFFQNQPLLAFDAALKAANFAEGLGSSAELARGYASLSVAFGFVPLQSVVDAYAERARVAAEATGDTQAIAFVAFLHGLSTLGAGRWAEARASLEQALASAREVQDRRRVEECVALLANLTLWEGRVVHAMDLYAELEESARRSGNAQGQLWAQSGRAQCHIELGRGREAIEVFEKLAPLVDESGDGAQQITQGSSGIAHLGLGDREAARRIAEKTLTLIAGGPPTAFHCLFGYAATAEVLLALWEAEIENGGPSGDRRVLRDLSRQACEALRRYARVFRVGRPDAWLYQGKYDWLSGRRRRAEQAWARSLTAAEQIGFPIVEGRAHYEIGRHVPADDPRRAAHLDRARVIFTRLQSQRWLAQLPRSGSSGE